MADKKPPQIITLEVSELLASMERDQAVTGLPKDLTNFISKFKYCISQKNSKEAILMLFNLRIDQVNKIVENMKRQKEQLIAIRETPVLELLHSTMALKQVTVPKAGLVHRIQKFRYLIADLEKTIKELENGRDYLANGNFIIVLKGAEEE